MSESDILYWIEFFDDKTTNQLEDILKAVEVILLGRDRT